MACFNCGAGNVVSGLCGMCQYYQTRAHCMQMQQSRMIEAQQREMRRYGRKGFWSSLFGY